MVLVGIYPISLDKSLALDRHLIVATFHPVWFLSFLQENEKLISPVVCMRAVVFIVSPNS